MGCARAPLPEPTTAVRRYLDALDRDDPHAAWMELSSAARARLPEREFTDRWRASADERRSQAAQLKASLAAPAVRQWAAVVFVDGGRVPIARDGGEWRLATTALSELHAATPQEALALLARALESRRYDLLFAVLSESTRAAVEAELRERTERLKAALEHPNLEINGDTARLQYDPRFHVELRRQEGEWRVLNMN
jgi:PAS domain-containing protein